MTGKPLTEEQIAFIRKHFANMTNHDLADAVGISMSSVSSIQKRYHLTKSEKHTHAMGVRGGVASSAARGGVPLELTPEIIDRRVAAYRQTFREERARVVFGLPQRTKIKVKKQPRKKCHQRAYLKHLGYIIDEQNCVAYWTPETKRAVRMEAGIMKGQRYYYKFVEMR